MGLTCNFSLCSDSRLLIIRGLLSTLFGHLALLLPLTSCVSVLQPTARGQGKLCCAEVLGGTWAKTEELLLGDLREHLVCPEESLECLFLPEPVIVPSQNLLLSHCLEAPNRISV